VSYAVLASASVLLAGLLAHRVRGRAGAALAVVVLGIAVVADGAPFWGADVGGVLTMVPAFTLAAVLLFHLRIRFRTLLLFIGATLSALALAAVADLSRPASSRTHLARLVEQIGGEGSSALTTVLHRKLEMSLSTLSSSQWRPMVPLVLAFVAFLVWGPGQVFARLMAGVPQLRAVLVGLALVAALGFALNDQGIVVPAVMLGVLAPALVLLVLFEPVTSLAPVNGAMTVTRRVADDR
jgi:hypothetical protein